MGLNNKWRMTELINKYFPGPSDDRVESRDTQRELSSRVTSDQFERED